MQTTRPRTYRSIFLSDFHMGAKAFDDAALLGFLYHCRCQHLYLAGDIIDGWKLKKRWHWTATCDLILERLAQMAQEGTVITYLPGNHDDEVRHVMPLLRERFARQIGFKIADQAVHVTQTGMRYLVIHGDQFDRKILKGSIARWSDRLYDRLMDFTGLHTGPTIILEGRRKPFSLAKYLAAQGKWALKILNNFEHAAAQKAFHENLDGVICGHTHIPMIKSRGGVIYANAGSWVGRNTHTALAEYPDGRIGIIDWPPSRQSDPDLPGLAAACGPMPKNPSCARSRARLVVHEIRRLWRGQTPTQKRLVQKGRIKLALQSVRPV